VKKKNLLVIRLGSDSAAPIAELPGAPTTAQAAARGISLAKALKDLAKANFQSKGPMASLAANHCYQLLCPLLPHFE